MTSNATVSLGVILINKTPMEIDDAGEQLSGNLVVRLLSFELPNMVNEFGALGVGALIALLGISSKQVLWIKNLPIRIFSLRIDDFFSSFSASTGQVQDSMLWLILGFNFGEGHNINL